MRLRLWTMGHFSAANLIDACRAYNALTAPLSATTPTPPPRSRRDDLPDPPASRSTDPGDLRR